MTAVAVGGLVGLVTGLLPGLHVNTLAALAVGVAVEPTLGIGLVAVGTVHTFVSIIPTTYLGAPSDDTALGVLPAHRMLHAGRGPEAVRIAVLASTWGLLLAIALLLPYKWLLLEPGRGLGWLQAHRRSILTGIVAYLLWLQFRQRPESLGPAVIVTAMAGCLGWLARDWPTDPLLPMLTGLFAVPTLLAAFDARVPLQDAPPARLRSPGVFRGTLVCALTAVLPGVTGATATAIATKPTDDPRPVLATLSVVNTAHLVFALCLLWIADLPRSGLARAVSPTLAATWGAVPPNAMYWAVATMLAAGIIGAVGTLCIEPLWRRAAYLPARWLHGGVLILLVALTWGLTGAWGVLLLIVSAVVGRTPLALGVRRVHLAGSLTVPIILM